MTLTPRTFRLMLVAQIPLAVLGLVTQFAFPELVPSAVRAASEAVSTELSTDKLVLMLALFIVVLIAAIVVMVGLYKFKPWARRANLIVGFLALVLTMALGHVVESGLTMVIYNLGGYLWGALTAITYFSNLSERFDKGTDTAKQDFPAL